MKFQNTYLKNVIIFLIPDVAHSQVPNLITFEFLLFIKSQFTINVQNYSPPGLIREWLHLIMDFHTLPKKAGRLRKGLTGIENTLIKSLFLFSQN